MTRRIRFPSLSEPVLTENPFDRLSHEDIEQILASKDLRWVAPKLTITGKDLRPFLNFALACAGNLSIVQCTLTELHVDFSESDLFDIVEIPWVDMRLCYDSLVLEAADLLSKMLPALKRILDGCRYLDHFSYTSGPTLDRILSYMHGESVLDVTLSPMLGMGALRRVDIDLTSFPWVSREHHLCPVICHLICHLSVLHLRVARLCPNALRPTYDNLLPLHEIRITIPLPDEDESFSPKPLRMRCGRPAMGPLALIKYERKIKRRARLLMKQMSRPKIVSISMPVMIVPAKDRKFWGYMVVYMRELGGPPKRVELGYDCFDAITKESVTSPASSTSDLLLSD